MNTRSFRKSAALFGLMLLLAAAMLLFCSRSSPAYPINDWCDANVYLTIGRGMAQGKVLYRDLYDHKGPLLYALHVPCALIGGGFFGVYLLETLCAAVFLYACARILEELGAGKTKIAFAALIGLAVYTAISFCEGDSAEELCMPLEALALLGALRCRERCPSPKEWLLQGILLGGCFWIKFSDIGICCGCILGLLLSLRRGNKGTRLRAFFRAAGLLLTGFLITAVPWLIGFGACGALPDLFTTYLYDNLFLYGGEGGGLMHSLKGMAKAGLQWMGQNPVCAVLILTGLMRFRPRKGFGTCLWCAAVIGALGVFIGGKEYIYYGQALTPLCIFGAAVPAEIIGSRTEHSAGSASLWICTAAAVLSVALCFVCSPNVRPESGYGFGESRENTMQYRFAARMAETPDASLLNFDFMDAGFYTAAESVPPVRFFHRCNVPREEMLTEQRRYIQEGIPDYVVTRGTVCGGLEENYELIDTCPSPGFWYDTVYLYRKL